MTITKRTAEIFSRRSSRAELSKAFVLGSYPVPTAMMITSAGKEDFSMLRRHF